MALPSNFDGRRLQKLAWTVPFKLGFAPVVFIFLIWLMIPSDRYYTPSPGELFTQFLPWGLGIGLFFSLCGLGHGRRFTSSASSRMANDFEVTELPNDAPLTKRVHQIAAELRQPMPKVGVMRTANAYAVGTSREDAAVIIGLPLIEQLNSDELDAIIGHELGHIVSGDMARMQMAAGFQSMVDHMAEAGTRSAARQTRQPLNVMLVVAIGTLIRRALFFLGTMMMMFQSRSREYVADAFGAAVTSPQAMIGALKKLHGIAQDPTNKGHKYACLMFINPGGTLLATHPMLIERIRALESGKTLNQLVRSGTGARYARQQQLAKSAAKIALQTYARGRDGLAHTPDLLRQHRSSIQRMETLAERHLTLLATGTGLLTFLVGLQLL